MILPSDLDRVQTVHFHVQCCPWLFSVLWLWLCSVDPFSCAQFLGYKMVSIPTKSGCFLFKWEILHEMPWLSFCLALVHWSLQIFSFTQELQGESTLMLCLGSHQKERSLHIIAVGKLLASSCICSDLLILSPFCLHCPLHFEFSSTATKAVKLITSETLTLMLRRKCITSLKADSVKNDSSYLMPTGNFPLVLLKLFFRSFGKWLLDK